MLMPPAASICIMSEVPERGSPETMVIMTSIVNGEASLWGGPLPRASLRQKWVDNAVAIGSPSIRTNLPKARDSKPDNCRHHETARRQRLSVDGVGGYRRSQSGNT